MSSDPKKPQKKIIIEGVTDKGESFRPADWAERMSGSLSTFRDRRVIYSPLLQPAVRNGQKCVVVDQELAETHPELYKYVLSFAEENHLKMQEEGENGDAKKEDKTKG
jgi:hypothetical protein